MHVLVGDFKRRASEVDCSVRCSDIVSGFASWALHIR